MKVFLILFLGLGINLKLYCASSCNYLCKSKEAVLNYEYKKGLLYAALGCQNEKLSSSKACKQYEDVKRKVNREFNPVVKEDIILVLDEMIRVTHLQYKSILGLSKGIAYEKKELGRVKSTNKALLGQNWRLKKDLEIAKNKIKTLEAQDIKRDKEVKSISEQSDKYVKNSKANSTILFLTTITLAILALLLIINFRKIKEILMEIFSKQIVG